MFMYVPNENYRNPLGEAKHQREPLEDYSNHMEGIGWAGGLDLRCVNQQPGGRSCHLSVVFRTAISQFQDYSIIPRTFI